jgi:hypothetical protein
LHPSNRKNQIHRSSGGQVRELLHLNAPKILKFKINNASCLSW